MSEVMQVPLSELLSKSAKQTYLAELLTLKY